MDIAITKLSSKGQIVIPTEMRKAIKPGEKLIIIENGNQLIIRRAKDIKKIFKEDVEFAKKTEKAFNKYKSRLFIEKSKEDFLNDLEKW